VIRVPTAAVILAALTAAAPIAAPQAGELRDGDSVILIEEWRAMTRGKTVYYSLNGQHWGREYFHPEGDRATFIAANGECSTAPWVYAEGVYCFSYTGMDCFRHVRRGEALLAVPLSQGEAQTIDRIVTEPLSCQPPLTS
jgi:hypothetical protein